MFGPEVFKSATLIVRDCDHELIPRKEYVHIKNITAFYDIKLFEWSYQKELMAEL
jgi:hypothetical protein